MITILIIIFFITYPEREIKIDLTNIGFKSEYEVYNELTSLVNLIKEMKNDRKSMLNLSSYFRKNDNIINESNNYFSDPKNNELCLFVYKYIEQTYKSMINKFENSVVLKLAYSNFLYMNLKKYDKAYIILFDLLYNKENELTISQNYYIYISLKFIQNISIENKTDIKNISIRFHCNQLINLISQIAELYYNFWSLLLNSKENKDINLLRKIGSKIQKFSEEIDFKFNKFSQLKLKDKNISLLYLYYKRDILNDFSDEESENEVKQLVEYSSFSINNLNLKSLISTSSFQFIIVNLKLDNFGTIMKISQELSIDLGYTSEELIGQNMDILLPDFIIQKHNKLIHEKIKDLKFIDKEENILKKHIFYFKTKSKFLIPLATYVGMIYDDDNKPFIFLKINFDIQQTLFRDLSTTSHIFTDQYFNIQNFTSNSIILFNLSNKIINSNVNIIYYIKEINEEYYKICTFNNIKSPDILNILLSILKKYFTEEPEEIITFHKIKCKISISKLIINKEILGYHFNLFKLEDQNINNIIKPNYSSSKSLIRKNNDDRNIGNIKISKTKKFNVDKKLNEFKDIYYDYIPENRQFNFNYEKKEYYLQNESDINITPDSNHLIDIIKKEYLEKKLEFEKQKSSSSGSSSNSSSSDSDEYSISNESSFSSINEKNNIINDNDNNNENDDYYHVKLNKIVYYIYNFSNNLVIEIPKTKFDKVEEIFFY